MYPIAWAVVEKENKDSWMWFLKLLKDDLDTSDGNGFALISDQQKVIISCLLISCLLTSDGKGFAYMGRVLS
jgi:hypothetical protein